MFDSPREMTRILLAAHKNMVAAQEKVGCIGLIPDDGTHLVYLAQATAGRDEFIEICGAITRAGHSPKGLLETNGIFLDNTEFPGIN